MFVNCFTNFILSNPNGKISHYHKKNPCKETLIFMERLERSYNQDKFHYLTDVRIEKEYGLFIRRIYKVEFKYLSHQQFQCLLECTQNKNIDEHINCHYKCFENPDLIHLNFLDGRGTVTWPGEKIEKNKQ